MDEACSNVRVQLDSAPEDIDHMQRHRMRLQVEGEGCRDAVALFLEAGSRAKHSRGGRGGALGHCLYCGYNAVHAGGRGWRGRHLHKQLVRYGAYNFQNGDGTFGHPVQPMLMLPFLPGRHYHRFPVFQFTYTITAQSPFLPVFPLRWRSRP